MELRTQRLMCTLGGSLVLSVGILAACSSDSGFSALPGSGNTAVDAGSTTKKDSATDNGTDDTDDAGGSDAGGDCAAAPAIKSSSDIYCGNGADGKTLYCKPANGEVCCGDAKTGTTFAKSTCTDAGATCTYASGSAGGREYDCTQASHCATGSVCCLVGGAKGKPRPLPDKTFGACGNYSLTESTTDYLNGAACETTKCATGETQLCVTDDECTGGLTCHYLSVNGHRTGFCK